MAKARRTPKAKAPTEGQTYAMHRPHLSPAEEDLAAQYRPSQACGCGKGEWLMETTMEGQPLEFYCTHCGRYVVVPRT